METLERAIEVVRNLAPHDLEQLRHTIDELLTHAPAMTEQEYAEHLAAQGIVTPPAPMTEEDWREEESWQPIEVGGKPLSQIIIEERR